VHSRVRRPLSARPFGGRDIEGKLNRRSTLLATVTIAFWLSFLAYLPPLAPAPKIEEFMAEVGEAREFVSAMRQSPEELESELRTALRADYIRTVVIVLLGLTSGVLLIANPPFGRIFAVILCSSMLLTKLAGLLSVYPHVGARLHFLLFVFLRSRPVYVIHHDIISTAFWVGTIVILVRRWPPNNALQRPGSAGR
jgi:hypothetical protein